MKTTNKNSLTKAQEDELLDIFLFCIDDITKSIPDAKLVYSIDATKAYFRDNVMLNINNSYNYHNIIHTYNVVKKYKQLELEYTGKNSYRILSAFYHDFVYRSSNNDSHNVTNSISHLISAMQIIFNSNNFTLGNLINKLIDEIRETDYSNILNINKNMKITVLQEADLYDLIYDDINKVQENFNKIISEDSTYMQCTKCFSFMSNLKTLIECGYFSNINTDNFYDNVNYTISLCLNTIKK